MAHVVMTTHWTGGDIYPFIRIGRRLKQRGHTVTLITHCVYQAAAEQAGIGFAALDTPEEWAAFVQQDMPRLAGLLNSLGTVMGVKSDAEPADGVSAQYEQIRHEYTLVKEHCRAPDSVLLARHASSIAALLVAEQLNIPIISVFMAPAMLSEVAMTEAVSDASLINDVNIIRDKLGFAPIRSRSAWVNAARYNIGLWPEWFGPANQVGDLFVDAVGFPLESQPPPNIDEFPEQIQALIRRGERPILISGGTGKILRSEFYSVCVDACRLLGWPTIVAAQYRELLPEQLPEHIMWFPYLPFEKLMPFMGAIIHHGGIGTISQAMIAGIPQLLLAHGLDRPDNAVRLKRLGNAEAPPLVRWKPDLIAESLQRLFSPTVRERCAVLAQRLSEADPLTCAAEVVERAASSQDACVSSADFLAPRSEHATQLPPGIPANAQSQALSQRAADKVANLSPEQLALLMQRLHQKKARNKEST